MSVEIKETKLYRVNLFYLIKLSCFEGISVMSSIDSVEQIKFRKLQAGSNDQKTNGRKNDQKSTRE